MSYLCNIKIKTIAIMDKKVLNKKIDFLISQISEQLKTDSLRAIMSGALDIDSYNDDYALPKIILSACLQNACLSVEPLSKSGKKEVKNLLNFI